VPIESYKEVVTASSGSTGDAHGEVDVATCWVRSLAPQLYVHH